MRLCKALETGLPFKRKNDSYWKTNVEDIILNKDDIICDYWEVKENPLKYVFESNNDSSTFIVSGFCAACLPEDIISFEIKGTNAISLDETDVDVLLDLLFKITKTGKSRIIPF